MSEHATANDELMISPAMIAARLCSSSRRLKRSSEIRHRERRHLVLHTQLDGRIKERFDCGTHLSQQRALACDFARMSIETTNLSEEDLSLHVDASDRIRTCFDEECNLFELATQRRIWEDGSQSWINAAECRIRLKRARADIA